MTIQKTDNEKQPTPLAAGDGSAISQEIGDACARLIMADSSIQDIIDNYLNGRAILSALNRLMNYKVPNHNKARKDLINALGL